MFLVKDQRYGTTYLVFVAEDPRKRGFTGELIEGVSLDYDIDAVHRWPEGYPQPEVCCGRAKDNPLRYKVFRYASDCDAAGYERLPGMPLKFGAWSQYIGLRLTPPDPEQIADEQWYDYLDKLDEDSCRRRGKESRVSPPSNGSQDEVAAWLAKTHIIADNAIREVWYLPSGAPPDEIRLLEVNDRLAGSQSTIDAVDFGLAVGGKPFRLVIADITSHQLALIREDPSRLPPGWSIDGASNWGRRAA